MMKKSILLGICAASLLCSCSDEWNAPGSRTGRIAPVVGIDTEAVTSRPAAPQSRAEGDELTADNLSIRIAKADGSFCKEWETLADFDPSTAFPVGDYIVEAFYGDAEDEGFEKPSYYGSQDISVADDKTTEVGLTAGLSKSMVTIAYTEAFEGYMADWSATVKGAGEAIDYVKGETRPVYVAPGEVTIQISVKKPNGLNATFTLDPVKAEARYHYTVTVDVNNGNVGDAVLNITFDENLAQEEVEIDLSDKVLSAPAPEIVTEDFTAGEDIECVEGLPFDGELKMDLIAMAGLHSVMLETKSTTLIRQGWPAEIDLMSATTEQQATLTSLGFKALGLWRTPGEMAEIDFAGVIKNLKVIANDDNRTEFTVTVKDALSRASEPMILAVAVEGPQVELASAGEFFDPGQPLNITLGFNGATAEIVKNNVSIEYYHPVAKQWRALEILEVSAPRARSMSDFTVTLATPDFEGDLVLRAKCGATISGSLTVTMPPFRVAGSDLDTYATRAFVKVIGTNGNPDPSTAGAEFYAKSEGETEFHKINATEGENGYFTLEGLTPNTTNVVRVELNGLKSASSVLHTEEILTLPNSGMEEWYREGGNSNWWIAYPGATKETVWGTMNLLTTSQGSTLTGVAPGAAYSAFSGTRQTTDVHGGSSAAVISNVGWGDGNTAWLGKINTSSWIPNGGKCEHLTVGELYLGSYNSTTQLANYSGYDFASRPAKLKFFYKYVTKNKADWGVAEIHLLDAAGNIVNESTLQLKAASSYTEAELAMTYKPGMNKAVKIQVMFKSSGNSACQSINNDNLSSPPSANLSNGRYTGSELYIDDIELIY